MPEKGPTGRAWQQQYASTGQLNRKTIAAAAVALLVACAQPAWSQPVSSFSQLKDRLVIGSTVTVIDTSGGRTVGSLSAISDVSLRLLVDGAARTFTAEETRRVQQRRSDSLINGLLIGAGAGAGYGIYWYIRDPNECSGSVCGSDLAMGAGIGALIGLAIDALIKENATLYVASGDVGAVQRISAPALAATPIRAALVLRW